MKTAKVFLFLLASALSLSAAAEDSCQATPEKFHIVFGNGILTTPEGAAHAKKVLAFAVGPNYSGQAVTYDLAFNYSNGAFTDMLQALDQAATQFNGQILLWLNGIGLIPDFISNIQQQILMAEYQINAPELATHVEKYREAILQGEKVLVVSHSQGNFYANQAKQILASSQPSVPMGSFGIFGVATPANNVGGLSAPYYTNHRDIIWLVPGHLPVNWTLKNAADGSVADDRGGMLAHGFVETYMSLHFDILPSLLVGIKSQLNILFDPPAVLGSGPLTAQMTWNLGSSDVDLHIYEPSGRHVYYRDRHGNSGFLDIDNVAGFGPEHYYTDCNQLELGEYRFGLNYYDDKIEPTRPVTATVTITAPGSTRTFQRAFVFERAFNGDKTPTLVGKVLVEKIVSSDPNLNGKLKYTISEM